MWWVDGIAIITCSMWRRSFINYAILTCSEATHLSDSVSKDHFSDTQSRIKVKENQDVKVFPYVFTNTNKSAMRWRLNMSTVLRCYITFSQSANTKLLKCIIDLCLTDEIHNLHFSLEFVVVSYSAAFWTNYRSHASVCLSKNTVRLCVVRKKTTPTICWMWLTYLHSTVTRNRVFVLEMCVLGIATRA